MAADHSSYNFGTLPGPYFCPFTRLTWWINYCEGPGEHIFYLSPDAEEQDVPVFPRIYKDRKDGVWKTEAWRPSEGDESEEKKTYYDFIAFMKEFIPVAARTVRRHRHDPSTAAAARSIRSNDPTIPAHVFKEMAKERIVTHCLR